MYRSPAPVTALLVNGVHCWATCWTIERTDGVTLRFTDHDRDLTVDGVSFSPAAAPSASARQKTEGLGRVMDVEVRGYIESTLITDEDLRAGLYRGAKVTEFIVDWRFPFAGKFQTLVYWVRETTFDRESWSSQCEGLLGRMKNKVGQVLNRTCRHTLGDASCQVDIAALEITASVSSIDTQRLKFTGGGFSGTVSSEAGYYDGGNLVWATGANTGLVSEMKTFDNGEITLQLSTPFDIAASDEFTFTPGCDKNLTTCKAKFSNVVNFGGYPTLVGVDKQFSTTGAPV